MRTNRFPPLLLAVVGAAVLAPLAAQERMTIYRCTGADGAVTVQNDQPCPHGTQQDRRVIQAAPAVAAPAPAGAPAGPQAAPAAPTPVTATPGTLPVAPVPAATSTPVTAPATLTVPPQTSGVTAPTALSAAPPLAGTDRLPPPALFECRTFDNAVYLGENANPPPRCAPLTTTGIGGTATPAGAACQMVTDTCQPVPAEALCDRWRQRLREMDAAVTFGRLDERETASVQLDRVRSIVTDSTCGL